MYKYPYGDSQQLNLDWIIAKIKDMEAAEASDLETISKALISLPYNTTTAYRRYDYAFLNGKLYRCLTNTSGVFNPTAWQEALIGDDLAVLTRWINAIDAAAVVDVKFDTSGTNGKLQQKYHDQYHDVVEVDYTPVQNSKRPLSSNAGYELNGAINNFRPNQLKRKYIFIGDSYGHASGTNQGWIDKLAYAMGITENTDYWQSAVGGMGFLNPNGFTKMITDLAATLTTTQKESITDIVVLGGANDTGTTPSNISSAVIAFYAYARSTFQNAKVYIGMISGSNDPAKIAPQYSRTLEGYRNCSSMTFLNNLEYVLHNRALLQADGIHPTNDGYNLLTNKIYAALNGGCSVAYSIYDTLNIPAGTIPIVSGGNKFKIYIENGTTIISFPLAIGFSPEDNDNPTYYPAMSQNTPYLIGNINQDLITAPTSAYDEYNQFVQPVVATVLSNINNTYYQVHGSLKLVEKALTFIPRDQILGTTSAFNQIKAISITPTKFVVESIMC